MTRAPVRGHHHGDAEHNEGDKHLLILSGTIMADYPLNMVLRPAMTLCPSRSFSTPRRRVAFF